MSHPARSGPTRPPTSRTRSGWTSNLRRIGHVPNSRQAAPHHERADVPPQLGALAGPGSCGILAAQSSGLQAARSHQEPTVYIIGTAGHVDHGKSTLVRALTGIDPDRLQEEKERGMTIDLGFAWLKLPSGQEVSLVDVPGHERFIKNMLAGVGGIDLALLVIAADEGVMPQTREHLAILDLLGVDRGIVVLTKRDLVDEEWLELVTEDVRETIAGTTLAHASLLAVSAATGAGLPELLAALDALLAQTPPKQDLGHPRLPVDRVFTIAGFGTVVTGTLIDGRFQVGQEVEIVPRGLRSRIRGLQTHRKKVEVAVPGSRVAANLSGLSTEDLARGDIVTRGGWLTPTTVADVKLRLISEASKPLAHGASVTVHLLASETPGQVRLLDRSELKPGETGWAQLKLEQPIPAVRGDAFIIRTGAGTVGGGEIVDTRPKRHRRFHTETLDRLAAMEQGSTADLLLQFLEKQEPRELRDLVRAAALPEADVRAAVQRLVEDGGMVPLGDRGLVEGALLFSATGWTRVVRRAEDALRAYHQQHPLRLGMAREELRSRLRLPGRASNDALDRLTAEGRIVDGGATVRLPSHTVQPTPQQQAAAGALLRALESQPFSPPTDLEADPELVGMLLDQRRIVRTADGILFTSAAFEQMVARITEYLRANGTLSVGQMRDMLDTTRKYALSVLEYLDQIHVTRRVGDDRVLR
ncbi:MAG: selenocysteine-specific translation elongation factor [Chloroflexi bacterium]|nr:selenocysteine-specific translation elongation factor [Chloroflexota bacterium]